MFDLANCYLQRGFNRGRYVTPLDAKGRFASGRGPGNFCFSWRSRHLKVSRSSFQSKTSCTRLEASV